MNQHRTMTDGLNLRLPTGMRDRLKAAAAINRRSMNAEVIFRLEHFEAKDRDAAEGATSPRHEHAETLTGNSNDYANK